MHRRYTRKTGSEEPKRQRLSTSLTNFATPKAGELTKYALAVLSFMGNYVWRQNNHHTPGRKFIGMRGMPDIVGYGLDGRAVWCEVKTINDRLSEDQITFMNRATNNGCSTWICTVNEHGGPILETWEEHRERTNKLQ